MKAIADSQYHHFKRHDAREAMHALACTCHCVISQKELFDPLSACNQKGQIFAQQLTYKEHNPPLYNPTQKLTWHN